MAARSKTTLTNWIDDFGQFLMYLGVLVATGLAFFLAFVLRRGAEEPRLRRWTWIAAGVAVVGMAVTGAAQSALSGGGAASIFHWSIERQSFGGRFGQQCGLQLLGLIAILASVDYHGWLVAEAEEDPVKVPALPKAKKARDYVRAHAGV